MEKQPSGELMTHIREHIVKWPATRDEIVTACNNLEHVPEHERKFVTENLPEDTYANPEEVTKVLMEKM